MADKKMRLFAGPNGSGKTTLIRQINRQFDIGYYINADRIEEQLNRKRYLEWQEYGPVPFNQTEWDLYLETQEKEDHFESLNFENLSFKEGFLVSDQSVNSYHASTIASFFREKLLLKNYTFSFETVMSHVSKVSFLKKAKERNFRTYLYFICTRDPEINKQRVKNRTRSGGHDVLAEKIESRYYRSLQLVYDAFLIADRAFVIDNSKDSLNVILEKEESEVKIYPDEIPEWVKIYLLDKL